MSSKRARFTRGLDKRKFKKRKFSDAGLQGFRALARRGRSLGLRNLRMGGLLSVEKKFFDQASITAMTAQTGWASCEYDPVTVLCLNGVPQGDTASTRDGYEIAMLSLEVTGNIYVASQIDATAADTAGEIYIAIVLDQMTNGAQLNSEDVYSNTSGSVVTAASPLRNMSYSTRFKVLKAVKMDLPQAYFSFDGTNIEQAGFFRKFKFYVDLKGLKTRFQAGTTTGYVGTIVDNSLHLIANCTNVTLAPTISYNCRLRYVG